MKITDKYLSVPWTAILPVANWCVCMPSGALQVGRKGSLPSTAHVGCGFLSQSHSTDHTCCLPYLTLTVYHAQMLNTSQTLSEPAARWQEGVHTHLVAHGHVLAVAERRALHLGTVPRQLHGSLAALGQQGTVGEKSLLLPRGYANVVSDGLFLKMEQKARQKAWWVICFCFWRVKVKKSTIHTGGLLQQDTTKRCQP